MNRILLAVALAGALLAAGCSVHSPSAQPSASRASAQPAVVPAPPPQNTVSTEPATIPILTVLSVERDVDILAQGEGRIVALNADVGTRVKPGAPLAQLDDSILRAQLDSDRASLVVDVDNVKYNEAEVKAKQAAYVRQQELHQYGLASDAQLEEAEFKAKGAKYDLDSWHAVVKRAEDQIHVAELEIRKMTIRAPFDGVITRRFIHPGQDVLKDEKCFELSQLAPLRVEFLVPETAEAPRAGMTVKLRLAPGPATVYSARVERVSPTVDPASGSTEVIAVLTGKNLGDLRPGMSVEVFWPAASAGSK